MFTLNNITKSFGKLKVLSNINVSVQEGELIYLYGKNGCGKSTLIKIICGIVSADQGSVHKEDFVRFGALIENPGFLESENLRYNLQFLANLTHHYNEEKIKDLCSIFSLDWTHPSKMKQYSLGMRQKVGIIQAIMEDQNVIFFDEPTRGLDTKSIEAFKQCVRDLVTAHKTVLIASHDVLEGLDFSRRWHLKDGILYEEKSS